MRAHRTPRGTIGMLTFRHRPRPPSPVRTPPRSVPSPAPSGARTRRLHVHITSTRRLTRRRHQLTTPSSPAFLFALAHSSARARRKPCLPRRRPVPHRVVPRARAPRRTRTLTWPRSSLSPTSHARTLERRDRAVTARREATLFPHHPGVQMVPAQRQKRAQSRPPGFRRAGQGRACRAAA